MPKKYRYFNGRGTTLVELIVTVIIFSVLMLGGLNFFFFAHNFTAVAKQEMTAVTIGKTTMEEIMTMPWDVLSKMVSYSGSKIVDGITYTTSETFMNSISGTTSVEYFHVAVTWPTQPRDFVVDFDLSISSPVVS